MTAIPPIASYSYTPPDKPKNTLFGGWSFLMLSLIASIALGVADTTPYRIVVANTNSIINENRLREMEARLTADIDRYTSCNKFRDKNDFELTNQARNCLLEELPKIKTATGATVISALAGNWLLHHPADEEVRRAGLIAVQNGRQDILGMKAWYYDTMERLAIAHDKSALLRVRDGRQSTDMLNRDSDALDRAEMSIRLPQVVHDQAEARIALLTKAE